jgi:outer membrane receptor protein involved in Fe transport
LNARVESYGLYYSDTFSITDQLALTLSGRYNQTKVNMDDQDGDELNGRHAFRRFNPAYGFTYNPLPQLGLYGGYSESSRAPTAMELSCADPEAPCKLPNAFISDPPLKQVVAKTWEGGFRGQFSNLLEGHLKWNAGVFHTENHDDILFISAGRLSSEGFFKNVGQTRRRGIELGLTGGFVDDRVRFATNYTYIDAKFRDSFIASSPNNPSADEDGLIAVRSGNRIPGIPAHIFKFSTDVDVLPQLTMGIDARFNSEQVFRGDEANLNSKVGAFWVFNFRTEYRVNDIVTLFGRVDNILDREYKTFGLYGEPDEVLGDEFDDPKFVGVGAPRAGWLGIRLSI